MDIAFTEAAQLLSRKQSGAKKDLKKILLPNSKHLISDPGDERAPPRWSKIYGNHENSCVWWDAIVIHRKAISEKLSLPREADMVTGRALELSNRGLELTHPSALLDAQEMTPP